MKAPIAKAPAGETPAARSFDDALNHLDDCLARIKVAADVLLEAAIGADIPAERYGRFSFCACVIEDYATKAGGVSDEAFAIGKKAAAPFVDGAA
jgi:hypothetical protein